MRKFLFTCLLGLTCLRLFSQSSAITTSAGTDSNQQLSVDWTLGEAFTEMLSNSKVQVASGAGSIATEFLVTGVAPELAKEETRPSVYPVPFDNEIFIQPISDNHRVEFTLYESGGKSLTVPFTNETNSVRIEAQNLSSGSYVLLVRNEGENTYHLFKLIKK